MRILLICLFVTASFIVSAQSDKVVKWSASAVREAENVYVLTLTAKIEKSWYVYSQFISDEGPVKTSVRLENSDNLELFEKSTEEGSRKAGFDDIFGMELIKYSNQMIIKQRIKSSVPLDALSGYIEFMTCNNEICYPPAEVYFRTPVN